MSHGLAFPTWGRLIAGRIKCCGSQKGTTKTPAQQAPIFSSLQQIGRRPFFCSLDHLKTEFHTHKLAIGHWWSLFHLSYFPFFFSFATKTLFLTGDQVWPCLYPHSSCQNVTVRQKCSQLKVRSATNERKMENIVCPAGQRVVFRRSGTIIFILMYAHPQDEFLNRIKTRLVESVERSHRTRALYFVRHFFFLMFF